MLFGNFVGALLLGASIVNGIPTSSKNTFHPSSGFDKTLGTSLVTKFDNSFVSIDRYQPTFKRACEEKKPEVLVNGLVEIHSSISAIGSRTDLAVELDVNVLTGKTLHLMVRLQVLLQIIDQHGMISACATVLVQLKGSLQSLVSVIVAAHIDITSKARTIGGVDFSFYARIGIHLNLGSQGTIDAGVGVNAGSGNGADVSVEASVKLVATIQSSTTVIANFEPQLRTACEQKNVEVVVRALATIRASITGLEVDVAVYARVGVKALTTNALNIFVKLQVLLRLIADNNLISPCQASIASLQAPLKAMISAALSIGIDISTQFLSSSVDLQFFAQIGLTFDITSTPGLTAPVDSAAQYFINFKASIAAIVSFAPQFKMACREKNVVFLNNGLNDITASITSLGEQTGVFGHVKIDVLSSHVFRLLVKLQALLRLITRYNLVSQCHESIHSLQAPLKTFIDILISVGIDVSAKAQANGSLDLPSYASVGIDLGIKNSNFDTISPTTVVTDSPDSSVDGSL